MLLNIVNGYVCRNCTDVENAKKGIDPAHPRKDFRAPSQTKTGAAQNNSAVILSGALTEGGAQKTGLATSTGAPVQAHVSAPKTGAALNVTV
jgi:hypothetical protein